MARPDLDRVLEDAQDYIVDGKRRLKASEFPPTASEEKSTHKDLCETAALATGLAVLNQSGVIPDEMYAELAFGSPILSPGVKDTSPLQTRLNLP